VPRRSSVVMRERHPVWFFSTCTVTFDSASVSSSTRPKLCLRRTLQGSCRRSRLCRLRGHCRRRPYGLRTALVTLYPDLIAQMSCNPAIGGIAKGHFVREFYTPGGELFEFPHTAHALGQPW